MSTTMKVIIGLLAAGFLVCVLAGAVSLFVLRSTGEMLGQAVLSTPGDVENVAASIAGYQLPGGFDTGSAVQVAGMSFVSHNGTDGHSHIMFFQLPAGVHVDQAEIERQFNQTSGQATAGDSVAQVVNQVETTICGQPTVMIISEGVNSDGQKFRQASATFEGRGGQALVMYETPVSSWDQDAAQTFFATISR